MGRTLAAIEIDLATDWFDWVSVGATVLGPVVVAIVALWIGERKAERRFNRQITEVASQFDRQLAQAEQRWQDERDLEARKWEITQKRDAYASHVAALRTWTASVFLVAAGKDSGADIVEPRESLQAWLGKEQAVSEVRIVGSSEYAKIASAVHETFEEIDRVLDGTEGPYVERVGGLVPNSLIEELIKQARREVVAL